jgi:molybdenum cofactor cytidylyltransferase
MTKTGIEHCAIIILAAGASTRLGQPKQLLSYRGKTLLRHAVDQALGSVCEQVVVVTGAEGNRMKNELKNLSVRIAENPDWEEGMASSIRCGVETILRADQAIDGLILMLCDQPFIETSLLNRLLVKQKETGKPIVASHYGNRSGTPALFHKSFFPELMNMKGDRGAGNLIIDNAEKTATVEFPDGIKDIDTLEDYESLVQ